MASLLLTTDDNTTTIYKRVKQWAITVRSSSECQTDCTIPRFNPWLQPSLATTDYSFHVTATCDWYSDCGATTTATTYEYGGWAVTINAAAISPMERLRRMIADRSAPFVLTSRKSIAVSKDIREMRARDTLRHMLGDVKYRLFLKNGFVSVRGTSGRVYQIFPGSNFTRVFENGKFIEQLCVILNDSYPPTDSLLMRYCILLNDEEHFTRLSNRHLAYDRTRHIEKTVERRPLTHILRDLRTGHYAAQTVQVA